MPNKAVVAYVFDDPDNLDVIRAVVAVSKPLFDKMTDMRIHAAVGDAADTISFFTQNGELPVDLPEESNWEKHTRRELTIIGEDPDMIECMCKVMRAYSSFGHSGGSHAAMLPVLTELLQFHNLSPLTNDPEEWVHIAEEMASSLNLWQNKRNPEVFSNDGGKTYYWVKDHDRVINTSVDKSA